MSEAVERMEAWAELQQKRPPVFPSEKAQVEKEFASLFEALLLEHDALVTENAELRKRLDAVGMFEKGERG